jgi:hypothetical protein
MRYVPPKRQLTFNEIHGVISQKIELFMILISVGKTSVFFIESHEMFLCHRSLSGGTPTRKFIIELSLLFFYICLYVFVLGCLACFPSGLMWNWILQTVGRTPWTGDQPYRKADAYTGQEKHRINEDRHLCLEWDSNPRFHCLSGRRHPLYRAATVIGEIFILIEIWIQSSIGFTVLYILKLFYDVWYKYFQIKRV